MVSLGLYFQLSAVLWETIMEGSFGFPNVDKGGALFTCDFVYDIPGLAINRRSNVIWRICVVADVFFGDAHRGKSMSSTCIWITFAETGYHTVGPFWRQFGSDYNVLKILWSLVSHYWWFFEDIFHFWRIVHHDSPMFFNNIRHWRHERVKSGD